MCYKIF